MRINRSASLPPPAWLLDVARDDTQLWCGTSVDTFESGFVEGAWDGSFNDLDFASCCNVFGSGAVRTKDGWLLVPPSHTLAAVYALHVSEGRWLASNSLAFLASRLGDKFSLADVEVEQFVRIVYGLDHSPTCIPTGCGDLYILHHHNAILARHALAVIPKPRPRHFACFTEYRDHLVSTLRKVAANATAKARRKHYRLLASISSGYDSTACAAIARACGCTDAVTFANARGGGSDDGRAAALALGLECKSIQRPKTTTENRHDVAEFLATGMQGEDINYDALRDQLDGRIFITGTRGDKTWDLHGVADSVLRRSDLEGCSLGEFRISRDFIHLPLPFVGGQNHRDILAISRSAEMKPFSVGGKYDRPVPRRIAEEAGVPRHVFGQSKKAISFLMFSDQSLISEPVRTEIKSTLRQQSFATRMRYRRRAASIVIQWRLHKVLRHLSMTKDWVILEHSHPFNQLALSWALKTLAGQYALESQDRANDTPARTDQAMDMCN